jgi:3-hydroxybutyryl-CoA dehydrogenase
MLKRAQQKFGKIGLIGLGLMGRGIAACLLSRGLEVIAYNRTARRAKQACRYIAEMLEELVARKVVRRSQVLDWGERFRSTQSLGELARTEFIIESVTKDLDLKRRIYDQVEAVVPARTVIASNTSSFPTTLLQQGRRHPARFIVMHWSEPATITRYLEIVPGEKTARRTVRLTEKLGLLCGKEPTVLNLDIRGFISNRLMYAMMREACYLVESGVADVAAVDRSFRNDVGWWATLAGPFRWMDLTGIPAYAAVMEGLFPELAHSKSVPELMKKVVEKGAKGTSNRKGFYRYTRASAREWEKAWVDFTFDVRRLVEKYEKQVRL